MRIASTGHGSALPRHGRFIDVQAAAAFTGASVRSGENRTTAAR
jgi:hypothetical protein